MTTRAQRDAAIAENEKLSFHLAEVLSGARRFETASQAVLRMILEKTKDRPEPVIRKMQGGKTVYDYQFFREGKKHIIGWFDEINDLVQFLENAAKGGSAKDMGIVFVSGPATGKTFFIDFLCERYRQFIARPENMRYSFSFVGLDKALGYDEKVAILPSMTTEDPMVLAMNLVNSFGGVDASKERLARIGFKDADIEKLYEQRRPLGASSEYIWLELVESYGGEIERALEHVKIAPIPLRESLGLLTSKYESGDKITASDVDLVGNTEVQRMLLLPLDDPNRFNLRRGVLARVAGGGIHFVDEMFKNKVDLIKRFLGVIQCRRIEKEGLTWPMDVLIIATTNNAEYDNFVNQENESPIIDRFRRVDVSHNTDYKLQQELTRYALGGEQGRTVFGEKMHEDPNLVFAASVAVVLTRLPRWQKLTSIQIMKMEAGEIAGEKGTGTLTELKDELNKSPNVSKRWGQNGLGHRDLGKALQVLQGSVESHEGKCLFAADVFKAIERIILDYVSVATDRQKYLEDIEIARQLYHEKARVDLFNAYREDPDAVRKDVLLYVNMVIGIGVKELGPEKIWPGGPKDPKTGKPTPIKIDEAFMNAIEERLGRKTHEQKEAFRTYIRGIYGQKITIDPNYDFMDELELVKAATDIRLDSEIGGAKSLLAAMANQANEENRKLRADIIEIMFRKFNYCPSCAERTIVFLGDSQKNRS